MLDNKVLSLIFFWFLATSGQAEGPCKGTEWSEWSACCKACTKSIEPFHERFREICNVAGEPMPLYDFQPCDPEELLTEWSSWSECNAECDEIGSLSRTRVCGDEEFTETEEQECSGEPCSSKFFFAILIQFYIWKNVQLVKAKNYILKILKILDKSFKKN